MATVSSHVKRPAIEYPTSDGRPMAETEDHRDLMFDSIYALKMHARTARRFYVSGNLLMYYEEGNKHKHVAPDVFAVRDLSKRRRKYYLVWEEGKGPDFILELTSKSTRREDLQEKFVLYRDTLKVQEYFLFDPHQEYLKPQLQGYRLLHGDYEAVNPVAGRLPSEVLGLHLEAQGSVVRFYDPATGRRLPTPEEARQKEAAARRKEAAARKKEAAARKKEAAARRRAEAEKDQAEAASQELTAENERLRRELDALRRRSAE